jgi:uncharacterized protein (DUF427 family)
MKGNLLTEPSVLPPQGDPARVVGHKWIRGYASGQRVVDSRQFLFVWDVPYWPWWFFPRSDIIGDLVERSDTTPGSASAPVATRYDLVVGERTLENAAWGYPNRTDDLADLVAIEFEALDHWFEEDVEVFVHPRSPFTRVDALPSSRHVTVSIDGTLLAESTKPTVLFETGVPARYYLPMTDVRMDLLHSSDRRSSCPYKGDSQYWSAQVADRIVTDIAWSYTVPRHEALAVAGLVCFYDELVDTEIDGIRQPRPSTHFTDEPAVTDR